MTDTFPQLGAALVVVTLNCNSETMRLVGTAARAGFDLAVIVDCGTVPFHPMAIGTAPMKVRVMRPGANIGYGPGCNLGAGTAIAQGATTLVLANPDLDCNELVLGELARQCREGELLAPVLHRPDGRVFRGGVIAPASGATAASAGDRPAWVSTALVAVRSSDWVALNGFDPRYFLYWDDVDLCTRMLAGGGTIRVDDTLKAVHIGQGAHRNLSADQLYAYLNCRNRLLYACSHERTTRQLLRWIFGSFTYFFRVTDLRRSGQVRRLMACGAGTVVGLLDLSVRHRWGPPPAFLVRRR